MNRRRRDLLLLLVLAFGIYSWRRAAAAYINDDCCFYLVIARHLATTGEQSFNGLFPTNGVHPLWTYLLAAYSALVHRINPALLHEYATAVPLSATLLVTGALAFRRAALNLRLEPAALVLIPVLFLLASGVLYSEAHASYAALGLLTWLATSRVPDHRWGPFALGAAAALVALARLDSLMFTGCFGLWLLVRWRALPGLEPMRRLAAFGLAFLAGMLPYLAANKLRFGSITPISGWLKSTFPQLALRPFEPAGLDSTLLGYNVMVGIVPLAASFLLLPLVWGVSRRALHLAPLFLGGSLLQFLYIALFTRGATGWHWYYVLPVVTLALCLTLVGERLGLSPVAGPADGSPPPRPVRAFRPLLADALLLAGAAAFGVYTVAHRWPSPTPEARPGSPAALGLRFARERGIDRETILVSDYPGYLAFRTRNPVIAADMLTGNLPLYRRLRAAPNALDLLRREAARAGQPIRYVFYQGNAWLIPSPDLQSVTFHDPRTPETPIGRLPLGPCLTSVRAADGRLLFAAWRLDG